MAAPGAVAGSAPLGQALPEGTSGLPVLIAACDTGLASGLHRLGLAVLPVSRASNGTLRGGDGTASAVLPGLPTLAVAAIAFSDQGLETLESLAPALADTVARPVPERVGPDDALALAAAVLRGADRLVARHAALLASTLGSLAALRIRHDDHQQRLAELEALASRGNRQPFDLAFAAEPLDEPLRLLPGQTLEQRLPLASRGLCAVGLHLPAAPAGGSLRLVLRDSWAGTELAQWSLPAGDLAAGWNVLGLARGLTGLRHDITLDLSCDDAAGLSVSLGGMQPLADFQLRLDGTAQDRSLAFRAWAGLPGLPPPVQAIDHAASGEIARGFEQVPLDLAAAEPAFAEPDGALAFDGVEDALDIDLRHGGILVARLHAALPPGAVLVEAEVAGDAGVEFALAADLPPAMLLRMADAEAAAPGWSGWLAAAAAHPGRLQMTCEAQAERRDLYMLCLARGDGAGGRGRFASLAATILCSAERGGRDQPAPDASPRSDAAEPPRSAAVLATVPAAALRGTGLHGMEHAGGRSWRWLQPRLLLELGKVSSAARMLVLEFSAVAPGLAEALTTATVNDVDAPARLVAEPEGAALHVTLPGIARRRDRGLKVEITFGRHFSPEGDTRQLAAACRAARIEA